MASGMPGGQPVADGQSGLRGHVSGRKAGAAGGDQQIHCSRVAPVPQRGFNLRLFVRYHGGLQHLIACLAQQLCGQRASPSSRRSPREQRSLTVNTAALYMIGSSFFFVQRSSKRSSGATATVIRFSVIWR